MLTIRDLIPWSRGRDIVPERRGFEHPIFALQREMDRMFDEVTRGVEWPTFAALGRGRTFVSPQVDVTEDEHRILVTAELPGMDEKDVEILLGKDSITISGEKKAEHEATEQGVRTMERSYGAFRRTLPIGLPIVAEKVEASFKNGVLTVVLPKDPKAEAKLRKIRVKGAPVLDKPEAAKKAGEGAKEAA